MINFLNFAKVNTHKWQNLLPHTQGELCIAQVWNHYLIIIFLVMVRWKFQFVEIPANAQKIELSILKTKLTQYQDW